MERSEKQVPSKASFNFFFCNLTARILGESTVKGFRVTKNVKENKFEGVLDKLELKKSFTKTV